MITTFNKFNESFEYIRPKTKEQLKKIIEITISKMGNDCSLNFIDVSLVKDMSYLFNGSEFNGDISRWDVGNVTNMSFMFGDSPLKDNPPKWYNL